MLVASRIGDSYVVIYVDKDTYIDARKDRRYPAVSFIEVVRYGHVIYKATVPNTKTRSYNMDAPETIVCLMRNLTVNPSNVGSCT